MVFYDLKTTTAYISFLFTIPVVEEIDYWLHRASTHELHLEMKYRFQKARYDLLIRALTFGFQHDSLFARNIHDTIQVPFIRYGKLDFYRVNYFSGGKVACDRNYFMYVQLPDSGFMIRVLIGYGYIFFADKLFFR